jgi:hypothetical protein
VTQQPVLYSPQPEESPESYCERLRKIGDDPSIKTLAIAYGFALCLSKAFKLGLYSPNQESSAYSGLDEIAQTLSQFDAASAKGEHLQIGKRLRIGHASIWKDVKQSLIELHPTTLSGDNVSLVKMLSVIDQNEEPDFYEFVASLGELRRYARGSNPSLASWSRGD